MVRVTSIASPWIDVMVARDSEGTLSQGIVARINLVTAVALLIFQALQHAAYSLASLVQVRSESSHHAWQAGRCVAGCLVAVPGIIRPKWATQLFKALDLYQEPSFLQRAKMVPYPVWVAVALSVAAIGLKSRQAPPLPECDDFCQARQSNNLIDRILMYAYDSYFAIT